MELLFSVTQESTIKKKFYHAIKKKVLYHDIWILQIISGFVCLFYYFFFLAAYLFSSLGSRSKEF